MDEIETLAQTIADNNGRAWIDCGEYERETFRDAAANLLDDDDEPPLDTCDGCGCAMKHKRISLPVYYACEDCWSKASTALGRTHDHVVIGIKR